VDGRRDNRSNGFARPLSALGSGTLEDLILRGQASRRNAQDSFVGLAGFEKLGVPGALWVCCAGSQTLRCVFQSDFWQLRSQ
jgi:hypothetical protein